jgi:hypothetical protein
MIDDINVFTGAKSILKVEAKLFIHSFSFARRTFWLLLDLSRSISISPPFAFEWAESTWEFFTAPLSSHSRQHFQKNSQSILHRRKITSCV